MHNLVDLVRRNRQLWAAVCWIVTAALLGFGAPFLVAGLSATSAPGAYASITRWVPGGLHTYGGIMLALAFTSALGLCPLGRPMLVKWVGEVMQLVAVFGGIIVAGFGASWYLSGIVTWQAMLYWGTIVALALVAHKLPPIEPPVDGSGRVA